jgi:hypothetical protein
MYEGGIGTVGARVTAREPSYCDLHSAGRTRAFGRGHFN